MEVETTEATVAGPAHINSIRLGNCEVCSVKPAKYTCPRCEVKTCCLACQKIHKQELNCDGVRDRTKYVPFNKFTDLDLASDYRLLEECGRAVEKHRKEIRKVSKLHLPKYLYNLRQAALSRNINLRILPLIFERRKKNSTSFEFKSKTIFWHVEWVFPGAENIVLTDERVSEQEKLNSVLSKYFSPLEDSVLQEKLQFYQSAGLRKVRLLLKAEQKGQDKYYQLDGELSFLDNLKNKTIIENPTIHVMLEHHIDSYNILDSDDEDNAETNDKQSANHEVIDRIIKKAKSEEKTKSKNFLFTSEHSDISD